MPFFKPKKKLTLKFNRHPKKKGVRKVVPRLKPSSTKEKIKKLKKLERTKPHPERVPDVVSEQTEELYQTSFCPESIKDAKEIRKHPEEHIEINIIRKSRVVDVFCIPVEKKTFHYKKLKYHVKEDAIYLMPTKSNLLMPSSYYREGNSQPAMFKNTNQGITGKALSLLYKDELYRQILFAEDPKYNLFIVILLIALLIAFGIGAYFVFVHGGGIITPSVPLPEVTP
jgi:hypothetical protein